MRKLLFVGRQNYNRKRLTCMRAPLFTHAPRKPCWRQHNASVYITYSQLLIFTILIGTGHGRHCKMRKGVATPPTQITWQEGNVDNLDTRSKLSFPILQTSPIQYKLIAVQLSQQNLLRSRLCKTSVFRSVCISSLYIKQQGVNNDILIQLEII